MKYLTPSIILLVLVTFSVFSSAYPDNSEQSKEEHGKKRFIANTEDEMNKALDSGCQIERKGKRISSLSCSSNASKTLNLQEDIRIFALDMGANIQIRADKVRFYGNEGAGRKIAILDTGYNYDHPELKSSYLGGFDFVNNDSDPMDDNGHGSHVAGLITADGVQEKARGVAPKAGIVSIKILDSSGSGYFSDIINGMYYIVDGPDGIYGNADDFKVDAISLSLGTSAPYLYTGYCDDIYPSLTDAIKYVRDKDILVVVAAGNAGNAGISLPGCVSSSTTVGAVDAKDKVASFSGRGSALDLVAPGVSLYSAGIGSSYFIASGTSMSTPIVSGVVALIKSAHPGYSDEKVENSLTRTARDLGKRGKDKDYGYGRVDALRAVI